MENIYSALWLLIPELVSKPRLTPKYCVASSLEMHAHPAVGGTALSKKLAP
jgi:hypothetical protein